MRNRLIYITITAAIVLLFAADIALGATLIPLREVWAALCGTGGDELLTQIVLRFRLPKALVALLAGSALSAAGLQMQTLFRNPLAGPYVLGISSGASLGVALFLLWLPLAGAGAASELVRDLGMVGAAWIGAALILMAVVAVSARIKEIMAVLILGMMFGSAAGALVEILQYFSPEGAVKSYVVWTMGSLGGVSASQLYILAPVVVAGLGLAVFLIKPLDMLLLGEQYARTTGLNIARIRILLLVSTTLLAGSVTAFCGPIGFVGIAVPHVARMLFRRADHRTLMPGAMLLGAGVLLFCDIVAQLPGAGFTLPVNTITALMGIPVVVMVILRSKHTSRKRK